MTSALELLKDRIGPTEARIVSKLVKKALDFRWMVTVNDGEVDTGVVESCDADAIYSEIGHTDQTVLILHRPAYERGGVHHPQSYLGWISLVHGNGEDVISDHVDNDRMAELVQGVY